MQYYRFSDGLTKYRLIPATENVYDYIKDYNKDYYKSIFLYNQEHYEQWKKTGTVAGISNVTTKSLVFDFDSIDVETSRQDALTLVGRLMQHGIKVDNIQISFSGNKGIAVEVDTDIEMTQEQFKAATFALASDLSTFDTVVNDSQRILRIVGTKHPKSGLFKFPLTAKQLTEFNISQVKELASSFNNIDDNIINNWAQVEMPETIKSMLTTPKKEKTLVERDNSDLDLSLKPKWMSDAKYALQQGFFESGERNNAFVILAATYKNQGFPDVITYRILKGTAELQSAKSGQEAYSSKELWNNVVKPVYGSNWKGGTFSYENTPLLQEITKRLNLSAPKQTDITPTHIHSLHDGFKNYVKNIDKNTILTGIDSLDEHLFISTGINLGIVGAPGSGKSALALNILSNTSKRGIKSVFASFDMASTRMYEKILYKITGMQRDVLYEIFKENPEEELKLFERVKEEFGNVYFFDKSASTVDDVKQYIEACNEKIENPEERIKLVMIDYFERLNSESNGDDTAQSKKVASQIQDLINSMNVAGITLLQPNKMSGDMSEPIMSYTNIKGSSYLAQSFRAVLGIFREGFNTKTPETDKYMTMNILKNDLGETASLDFAWNGKRGQIAELNEEQEYELGIVRKRKAAMKTDLI